MGTILGLVGLVFFAVCVIALAAAVTWLVVKVSPSRKQEPQPPPAV
jgi:hypothetical protein